MEEKRKYAVRFKSEHGATFLRCLKTGGGCKLSTYDTIEVAESRAKSIQFILAFEGVLTEYEIVLADEAEKSSLQE